MSRLRAIVRPNLVTGFQLAGVETYSVDDVEAAEALILSWLGQGEASLLAVEDSLLAHLDVALLNRLDASDDVLYIAIPGGGSSDATVTRSAQIARMIRRSIGVRITFGDEKDQGKSD
jgi:vacuolar-type H+-ATPase subunit F/Vma7